MQNSQQQQTAAATEFHETIIASPRRRRHAWEIPNSSLKRRDNWIKFEM